MIKEFIENYLFKLLILFCVMLSFTIIFIAVGYKILGIRGLEIGGMVGIFVGAYIEFKIVKLM